MAAAVSESADASTEAASLSVLAASPASASAGAAATGREAFTVAPDDVVASSPRVSRQFLACLATMGLCGGMVYGYNVGAGAYMDQIRDEFELQDPGVQLLSSAATVTDAMAMFAVGAVVLDRFGRRSSVLAGALCNIGGCLAGAGAGSSYNMVVVARLLQGVGNGICILAVPMLLSESTPVAHRGSVVAFFQLGVVVGFALPFPAQLGFGQWRVTFALGAVPGLLLLLLLACIWRHAESKAWLGAQKLAAGTSNALLMVADPRRGVRHQCESDEMDWDQQRRRPRHQQRQWLGSNDAEVLEDRRGLERALLRGYGGEAGNQGVLAYEAEQPAMVAFTGGAILACVIAFTNNSSDAIIFYGPQIMERTGLGNESSLWTAFALAAVNVPAVAVVLAIIHKFPRRALLLGGLATIVACYAIIAAAFLSKAAHMQAVVFMAFLVLLLAFQVGPGTLFVVILPELFQQSDRAQGMAVGTVSMSLFSIICNGSMLSAMALFGEGFTFLLYGSLYAVCFAVLVRFLPETRRGTV